MSVVLENQITLTAPEEPIGWHKAIQNVSLPHTYKVVFHTEEWGWGVILSYQQSGAHWLVACDPSTGVITIHRKNIITDAYDLVAGTQHETVSDQSDMEISFREMRFGDATTETYYAIGVWSNNKHILSHSEPAAAPLGTSIRFGFAVREATTRKFTNMRIPELSTFVDWLSIDPGETPMSGLQRAIEGQYIKFFMRWNGAIRVWRPKASDVVHAYDDIADRSLNVDLRELKTHVRMIGGYAQAEYHRTDLTQKYGHRFAELNNPYLLTEAECYEQAQIAIQRMAEAAETETFTAEYNPLVEPEDHVETPDGYQRIVTSRSVSYDQSTAIDSVSTRSYAFEDPA